MSYCEKNATQTGYLANEIHEIDTDLSEADREEKHRLIKQVLELQHTLADLSQRVDSVKEENVNLRSENQILGQYIEKLMATSSIFKPSSSSPPQHPSLSAQQISNGSGLRSGNSSVSSSTVAATNTTTAGTRRCGSGGGGVGQSGFQYDDETSEFVSEDDIA